jgi:glycosyltransferase involved in cell wall biosynthesis
MSMHTLAPKPLISVVVPVHFEEMVLEAFYERVVATFERVQQNVDFELLFVNDGSSDRSLQIMLALRERDPRLKVIHLSRNFGHQIAVTAGIDNAFGDAVVLIDSDLQDPPEVILEMLQKWREGYKVVYGVRSERRGESRFKLLTAQWFYRALDTMSEVKIPLDTGDFRLMDRVVVEGLREMREESRYVRGMVSWLGFPQCGVPYTRDARFAGETKYTLFKMMRFAMNGLTSFSESPLVVSAWIGAIVTLVGLASLVYIIVGKLLHPDALESGWASLMTTVIFFGGVQLLSLGVLGQYIGRVYREVKRRPLYVVEAAWGLGETARRRSTPRSINPQPGVVSPVRFEREAEKER